MAKQSLSVIVTNFNGYRLLKRNLVTVIESCPEAQEIIVTDDASTDKSLYFLRRLRLKFPHLKILSHKNNLGFGSNTNQAVKKALGDFVVLLNNDIRPQPNFLKPALKLFSDPKLAAVGFSEIGNENWAKIYWSGGYLQHSPGQPTTNPHPTAWVSGGGSIFRRDIFSKMGGFDPAYAPFYYEDADLGIRLWKAGYRLLWCPESQIEHRHESTMSRFPPHYLNYVKERNRLLLTLRLINDPSLLAQNRLALLGRVLSGPNYLKIIFAARRQMKKYPPTRLSSTLSDQSLLSLFS